jgi:tetratricopeptide (TPR) repeat protein
MCPILKKLTKILQRYREVTRLIDEVLESKRGNDCRVLEHLLSFAEHQFEKRVTGKQYRVREDGERISNWIVEIVILYGIIQRLLILYRRDHSLSTIVQDDMCFPYLERSLSLLNPWVINLDSDASSGNDSLNEDQRSYLLGQLYHTELNMAVIAMNKGQFNLAEGHCQRCLAYSRRYGLEGEEKITMIFHALSTYCSLRERQGNYSDAVTFAEECYNLVVEAYDPVHPQVQEAAGVLINILISKGDLFDSERYAQVTYGNLRDKKNGIDQESEAVAEGAYNLARVIHEQRGDFIKAEELARDSLRITSLVKGSNHSRVGRACSLLANILTGQGQLGDETRGLYERSLANSIQIEGPDGPNTASVNSNLGLFYCQLAEVQTTVDLEQKQLLLAKAYFEESHRIRLKIYGSTHPGTIDAASELAIVLSDLSEIELL